MSGKIYVYKKRDEDIPLLDDILAQASNTYASTYDLYIDSNRDYIALGQLKQALLMEKGLLIVSSINSIGCNKADVVKELIWLKERHIETIFADYPATHIFDNPAANELALSVIIDVYSSLLDNKSFDIRPTLAAQTGRKKIRFPENWETLYNAWENGEISAKEFIEKSGLKKGTFYHLVNEYKELLKMNERNTGVG